MTLGFFRYLVLNCLLTHAKIERIELVVTLLSGTNIGGIIKIIIYPKITIGFPAFPFGALMIKAVGYRPYECKYCISICAEEYLLFQ